MEMVQICPFLATIHYANMEHMNSALDIQIVPEKILVDPPKHTQNTLWGGIWIGLYSLLPVSFVGPAFPCATHNMDSSVVPTGSLRCENPPGVRGAKSAPFAGFHKVQLHVLVFK